MTTFLMGWHFLNTTTFCIDRVLVFTCDSQYCFVYTSFPSSPELSSVKVVFLERGDPQHRVLAQICCRRLLIRLRQPLLQDWHGN